VAAKDESFKDFVLDQLGELPVQAKAMFGAHGLYLGGTFFGVVFDDRLFFKTNDDTLPKYEERGMSVFRPNDKQRFKNYYEVPPDVIEDPVELPRWAEEAADS
jgi:DNA transformation protein and related proteins